MSQTSTHHVTCRCGATVEVFCADSINAERHPHMRAALLDRTLHVFRCDACLVSIVVDKPLLYIDLSRRQMYAMHPVSEAAREREHGQQLIDTWSESVGDRAGEGPRTLFDGQRFHVRLCYGLEELREKLVSSDACVRDLPLEVLKAQVLAEHAELERLGVVALHLDGVTDSDKLVLVAEIADGTLADVSFVIDRERYEALAAEPWESLLARFPGIASGPRVSMTRWMLPL